MTPDDVANQLVARINANRISLASLPVIPPLAVGRAKLQGKIEALQEALAMVRRL